MAGKKKKSKKRKPIIRTGPCPYCKTKKEPDYKNYQDLRNYLSDRAKIHPGSRTGVCSKHQRRVEKEIKRARHLGLLPFVSRL